MVIRLQRILLPLIAAAIIPGVVEAGANDKFKLTAGIGYDFLSQEFFLDSASQAGADSTLVGLQLKNDYLDDVKGIVSITLLPYGDRRLELISSYEQTPDYLRTRFMGDLRLKLGSKRLSVSSEVEWKNRYSGTSSFSDSYLTAHTRAKITTPLSGSVSSYFQVRGDLISYDSVSEFSYNYSRLEGKLGLSKSFENFSFADVNLFVQHREVPDTLNLNYLVIGGEASTFIFYSGGEIDIYTRLEEKNYNQPDHKNDHYRYELLTRHKLRFEGGLFTQQEFDFEFTQYDPMAAVDYSYARTGLTILFGYQRDGFAVGLGPDFENLSEADSDSQDGEDYFESGIRTDLDFVSSGRFFASLESVLGQRDLKFVNDYQSDFTFERLSLIADLNIYSSLNLSVLFSAEWEWHDNPADNSRLFLLSSNLGYSF